MTLQREVTNSVERSPSWETHIFSIYKLHAFYGTPRFITVFTKARHLSLSWARSIKSNPQPVYWGSILILSSHLRLGLPRRQFSFGFRHQNRTNAFSFPPVMPHTHPISFFSIRSPNNDGCGIQFISLHIVYSPFVSFYLFLLRPK